MKYRWRLFFLSITGALTLLFALVLGIWKGGVALAVPIAGVGDFTIEASEIDITSFKLLPKMGETSDQTGVPLGSANLDAVIKDLKLYKDVEGPGGKKVRVMITAAKDVEGKGIVLDLSGLQADGTFQQLAVSEKNSPDWTQKFGLAAPNVVLKHPVIQAHYLYANSISLPGLALQVQLQ